MMKRQNTFLLWFLPLFFGLYSCANVSTSEAVEEPVVELDPKRPKMSSFKFREIDIQGHRGCRGLMPENTIPAFMKALELGVRTLELDVVVTKDSQVVLSHEPWVSHLLANKLDGQPIGPNEERRFNIYQMSYLELVKYDCGSLPHPYFPTQQKMKVIKPRLLDVAKSVKLFEMKAQLEQPIHYNIEIKRLPEYDGRYCPPVEQFVDLVLEAIDSAGIAGHCNIQAFDWETLRLVRQKRPEMPLSMLIEESKDPQKDLDELGFTPEIYSCHFSMVNDTLVDWVKGHKMQLIPWTVNETADIEAMLAYPLDGIISDYPNRVMDVLMQ